MYSQNMPKMADNGPEGATDHTTKFHAFYDFKSDGCLSRQLAGWGWSVETETIFYYL